MICVFRIRKRRYRSMADVDKRIDEICYGTALERFWKKFFRKE